ncbi:MAG: Protease synthase and sporulation protein 2 [Pseudomonadota bacterium]
MREHPLGSLVTTDDEGFPYVTHLPLRLETLAGGEQRLLGHCARANPQWKHLLQRPMALVSFMGPHAYMSPKVYADLQRVPTWSYVAVQARVRARVIEGEAAKDALLKQLIADHEPTYADQWRALPEDYTDLQCAVKLNQHRPESHAAMYQAYRAGGANEQALADWMQRMGLV